MYRLALHPTLKAIPLHSRPIFRTFLSSPLRTAHSPDKPLSQGHATSKSQETLHKDVDIQSASVRAGQDAKADASKKSSEEDAPFDAARQGGAAGSAKESTVASQEKAHGDRGKAGSFQDQVGGQDEPDKGPGVVGGGKEQASRGSIGDSIKQTLGFSDTNKSRKEGKSFHTSARAQADFPTTDADGSREPTEKDLHGEQNEHLKHKEEGEKDKGKGNAAEDPHLPSKTRKFHTSARSMATKPPGGYAKAISPEPVSAGYDAPPEALPPNLSSAYSSSDPAAVQPPPPNTIPSSEGSFSSTARDPPNEALRSAAIDGTLPEKNEQPSAEMGRMGVREAWKHRK